MRIHKLLVVILFGFLPLIGFIAIMDYSAQAQVSQNYLHLEPPAAANHSAKVARTPAMMLEATAAGEIITNVLDTGDDQIHGLIYHEGNLWASTRTSPARILKINPETLTVTDTIVLENGQNEGEDIVAAEGYYWTILFTEPAQLIRINPDTMTASTAIVFDTIDNILDLGTSLEYAFGFLWVGGLDKMAQVVISNPLSPTYQIVDYSSLATEDLVFFTSLTSSDSSLWGAMIHYSYIYSYTHGTVINIDPTSPGDSYITRTVPALFPDDTTFINGHYYISSEDDPAATHPSDMYKFPDDLTSHITTTAYSSASYGTFLNPLDPESIWGVYVSSPGTIKKFDLSPTALVTITLPTGFDDPSELAFDELGNMYAVTWQAPAGIVKYPAPVKVPDLTVSRSGIDAVLSWPHSDGNAIKYQAWRSADADFNPGDLGSQKIAEVVPLGNTVTYTDTNAIGDLGINYTYGVKAVNEYGLVSPFSNHATLLIYPADTTTSITSHTPNPSELGQQVSISYSTTSDVGVPTGIVTVSDGINWCKGTVVDGRCDFTFITSGTKSLVATYSGDPYFNISTSSVVTHTVNEPSEPWTYIHLPLVLR